MANKYLFYISQNYSFEILRPLQAAIRERGDQCAWFVEGEQVKLDFFQQDETRLESIQQAIDYQALAVFVPGNIVPNFIPGLKVQVFHGLEYKKKGHFRIRGFFDLYCTHGEITTNRFNELADHFGYFAVKETGWPKLDPLFQTQPLALETDLPVVLFAPTFSPNLTCAVDCFDTIKKLIKTGKQYWLIKFHPKMNPDWINMYRKLTADNLQIIDTDTCLPLLQRADIMLSDTSSMVGEFLLLQKPVVTVRNSSPGDYLIDIQSPDGLDAAIDQALAADKQLLDNISQYSQKLHPYQDGHSSERVLQAVDEHLAPGDKLRRRKPRNLWRSLKLRKKLHYWK